MEDLFFYNSALDIEIRKVADAVDERQPPFAVIEYNMEV